MQPELDGFLAQVESIERTIDLRNHLIEFGQSSPDNLPIQGKRLWQAVRELGISGMQPSLDGSVLLIVAAFEQFVSDVTIKFAGHLPDRIPTYADLKDTVRSANERLTGEALSRSSFRFSEFERQRFVANLQKCHAGDAPYILNGEAMALNDRNLTPNILRGLIGRLGVNDIWEVVGSTETLREWAGHGGDEAARFQARNLLDELIDNRNQIAHRVGSTNPGPEVVRSYLVFQRALAQSLVTALTSYAESLSSA